MFLVGFYFVLALLVFFWSSYLLWWSVFLMTSICFFYVMKAICGYSSLFNYFFIQEVLGLLFVLLFLYGFQVVVLLIKVGVAPFHFWLLSLCGFLSGFGLFWFLTFQKLPFVPVLLFFGGLVVGFLMFGVLFCYYQFWLVKYTTFLLVVSSAESFSWLLFFLFLSGASFVLVFIYYFLVMCFLLKGGLSATGGSGSWELALVFLNFPLSMSFFLKLMSVCLLSEFFFAGLFVLLLCMFLSVLSLSSLFFGLSLKTVAVGVVDFVFLDVVLFANLFLFLVLFYISKKIMLLW